MKEAAAVCLLPLLLREKGGNPEDCLKVCGVSQILMILKPIFLHCSYLQGPMMMNDFERNLCF